MSDLVSKRCTQLRVMVNACLQGGVPWLRNSCKSICIIFKSEEEGNYHFLLSCKGMGTKFDLFWSKLFTFIETKATFETDVIINFLRNLDDHSKVLLLTGGLKLPFQCFSVSIARFMCQFTSLLGFVRDSFLFTSLSSFSFHAAARWSINDAFSLHHVLT